MCIRRFVCLLVSHPCCIVCVPPSKICELSDRVLTKHVSVKTHAVLTQRYDTLTAHSVQGGASSEAQGEVRAVHVIQVVGGVVGVTQVVRVFEIRVACAPLLGARKGRPLGHADGADHAEPRAVAALANVLGARCGESRSPVLSPGSKEPRRETGPAAMGHPPWGMSSLTNRDWHWAPCIASALLVLWKQ